MIDPAQEYFDKQITLINQARSEDPKTKYQIADESDLEMVSHLKTGIYIIYDRSGDPSKTFKDFQSYKEKKERACPKANQPNEVMYVGSTTTGMMKRLKQHLGYGPKQTYALHLNQWYHGKYLIKVLEYEVAIEVLQLIEDSIAFTLNPAFGKRGGNNR